MIEITETALINSHSTARAFAERLRVLGVKLALDDFGTGYGGLTYLKHFPVDYLKVDVEFVRDLRTSGASRQLVENIVSLARSFDIRTVAEGRGGRGDARTRHRARASISPRATTSVDRLRSRPERHSAPTVGRVTPFARMRERRARSAVVRDLRHGLGVGTRAQSPGREGPHVRLDLRQMELGQSDQRRVHVALDELGFVEP